MPSRSPQPGPWPGWLTLALAATVLLAACSGTAGSAPTAPVWAPAATTPALGERVTAYDPARPAPALRLTDQDGRPFDLASLRGRPVLVYFGYTHCPDVCPTTLADIRAALRLVDVPVGVVFVTVDPARDDAAAMKQYVDYYASGFIGLTGSEAEIADAAAGMGRLLPEAGVHARCRVRHGPLDGDLPVDAAGMLRHHLFFGAGPELIAERINEVAG